jgi:hypothetical protein
MGIRAKVLASTLSQSISSLTETLKEVVQDSVEDLARNLGRWAKGTAILYGIGAVLALVSLTALCMGLAEALAAAGLPLYAGYLIVAAAAGIVGVLLFKRGSTRRVTPRSRDDAERPRFRVRIVAPRAPKRSRRSKRARAARRNVRSRSGRVVIHVPDGRRL